MALPPAPKGVRLDLAFEITNNGQLYTGVFINPPLSKKVRLGKSKTDKLLSVTHHYSLFDIQCSVFKNR